jgi:hypothetical protein
MRALEASALRTMRALISGGGFPALLNLLLAHLGRAFCRWLVQERDAKPPRTPQESGPHFARQPLLGFCTSSSESVLPRMIAKLENLGPKKSTVGLVIPTGYSFNLDGTAIYLTMAAVFIVQATNTPLKLTNQLTLLGVLLLTSKGAAGITGSGFIVLAATLSAVGHVPVAGLALILGIDRFMSEARALTPEQDPSRAWSMR